MKMNTFILSLALVLGLTKAAYREIHVLPEVIYEGMAYPNIDHDEYPEMIPVEDCHHGCAVKGNLSCATDRRWCPKTHQS